MPVLEGYENADTPHAKTVMAPGWTYGCHSNKVGVRPLDQPKPIFVPAGSQVIWNPDLMAYVSVQILEEHTTHWLTHDPDGSMNGASRSLCPAPAGSVSRWISGGTANRAMSVLYSSRAVVFVSGLVCFP